MADMIARGLANAAKTKTDKITVTNNINLDDTTESIASLAQQKQDKLQVFADVPSVEDLSDEELGFYYADAPKINSNGTNAPRATDDSSINYEVGSRWIDKVAGKDYVCLDATEGAAVWKETTLSAIEYVLENFSKSPDKTDVVYTGSSPAVVGTNDDPEAAFNEANTTYFSALVGNSWVKVQFDTHKYVTEIAIFGPDSSTSLNAFKLQGSNNDETWVDLHEGSVSRNGTLQTFTVTNPGNYIYYRLYEVSNHGNATITRHADVRLRG